MKTKSRRTPASRNPGSRTAARERAAPYRIERDDYPFTVRPLAADEGGGYLIEFPDLPGCVSDGETIPEAIENGMDAKSAWLAVIREEGRPVPEAGGQLSGKWLQRAPKSVHARLVERAAREGVSLNTLVVSLIAEGLGKSSR